MNLPGYIGAVVRATCGCTGIPLRNLTPTISGTVPWLLIMTCQDTSPDNMYNLTISHIEEKKLSGEGSQVLSETDVRALFRRIGDLAGIGEQACDFFRMMTRHNS
jgi:hypothetical protein